MPATRRPQGSVSAIALAPAPRPDLAIAGSAGSAQAMGRLRSALKDLKSLSVEPLLQKAVAAINAEDAKTATEQALKALALDECCGMAWYCLAIAREKAGDFAGSIKCYESALQLSPNHAEIANDLGRLAYRMDMKPVAEKLFLHYLAAYPNSFEAANNLACCLRDQHRFDDAVEVLKSTIGAHPRNPMLWNTLGTVLTDQGEVDSAIVFYDEALRLDPGFVKARYNRSTAKLALGEPAAALVDCDAALKGKMAEHERTMMRLARATMLITNGDLGGGWDAYEERLSPHYFDATHFLIERPQWTPKADLDGKSLLVMAEQGLGDEVMFSNLLPDVIQALGPNGKLSMAVEPRLVTLFQRSFPGAVFGAHRTFDIEARTYRGAPFIEDFAEIDLWAPIASLLRRFRRSVDDFPPRPRFMIADPARVAHWRGVLAAAPPGLKVGILWKSLKLKGNRLRQFSPFERWRSVLQTCGVCFVNLQYGDCEAELAQARTDLGIDIWTPPGIDLKDDLDDVAALTCALDLTVGPMNATTNIAAACGAPVWLISIPGSWAKLGTEGFPWYPQTRTFNTRAFNQWDPVMAEAAEALANFQALPGT